jgi:hypothetical protein
MTKQVMTAAVVAAAASFVIGGLWSLLGLPGGAGPVFGVVFAVVFFLAPRRRGPSDNAS